MNQNREEKASDQNQRNISQEHNQCYEGCQRSCGLCCGFLGTWVCCMCCSSPYVRVGEGTVAIITEYSKFNKLYAPGLYFVNPCTENMMVVDKREQVMDARQQSVITKDNINVIIDAVVYYQIENSYRAVFAVENLTECIKDIAKTSLRDVIGTTTLQQVLEDRDKTADDLYKLISGPAASWGVNIKRVLIQEILFTPELRRSLSSAATAKRIAESKVITAQASVQSAKLMRNSSEILNTPAAMQIKYLECINAVAHASNPKIVFYPSDYKQVGSKQLANTMGTNKM